MKLALVTNQLGVRGTEVALAAYARNAVTMWGWEVWFVVCHAKGSPPPSEDNLHASYEHYEANFAVRYAPDDAAVDDACADADVALVEIAGFPTRFPQGVPTVAHCVLTSAYPLQATLKTAVSESVAASGVCVLPNIVDAPAPHGDLRGALGIPPEAVVFGRHGGYDTFDIGWARDTVVKVARDVPAVYFVFMHTRPFCTLPNVLFLDATPDPHRKAAFVATCDAMVHARAIGETFGLAIAEFAVQRKPVFTHDRARDTEHFRLLGSEAVTYASPAELERRLTSFEKRTTGPTGYERYAPQAVMPVLRRVVTLAIAAHKQP